MISRRGFLGRLLAGAVVGLVAGYSPLPKVRSRPDSDFVELMSTEHARAIFGYEVVWGETLYAPFPKLTLHAKDRHLDRTSSVRRWLRQCERKLRDTLTRRRPAQRCGETRQQRRKRERGERQ